MKFVTCHDKLYLKHFNFLPILLLIMGSKGSPDLENSHFSCSSWVIYKQPEMSVDGWMKVWISLYPYSIWLLKYFCLFPQLEKIIDNLWSHLKISILPNCSALFVRSDVDNDARVNALVSRLNELLIFELFNSMMKLWVIIITICTKWPFICTWERT